MVPHPISIIKEAMGHNSREMLVVKDKVVMDMFDEGKCNVAFSCIDGSMAN